MKFQIVFKDPDCQVVSSDDGKDAKFIDQLPEEAQELIDRFLEYSEYVTIAFDTETGTATIVEP